MDTQTRIALVFRCPHNHVLTGAILLHHLNRYLCPFCFDAVDANCDISQTETGKWYLKIIGQPLRENKMRSPAPPKRPV